MNIAILESLSVSESMLNSFVKPLEEQGHTVTQYARTTDVETLKKECEYADVLILGNMPLPGEVITSCKNLKYIDIAFTGVDHVDINAAKQMNVKVSNASGYATNSVAELTICVILNLLRHVREQEQQARNGGTKAGLTGCELMGKTVGIIGTGKIGLRVAELCQAFGCKVLGYSRRKSSGEENGVSYVPLEELLAQSDIVALHCPLNAESKDLINQKTISYMKKTAILINMARGPVVHSQDLADALSAGRIAGAAIDVLENEPPFDKNHPLLKAPNVLVTPHTAFASAESMDIRAEIVFDNLAAWMKGEQKNVIA